MYVDLYHRVSCFVAILEHALFYARTSIWTYSYPGSMSTGEKLIENFTNSLKSIRPQTQHTEHRQRKMLRYKMKVTIKVASISENPKIKLLIWLKLWMESFADIRIIIIDTMSLCLSAVYIMCWTQIDSWWVTLKAKCCLTSIQKSILSISLIFFSFLPFRFFETLYQQNWINCVYS